MVRRISVATTICCHWLLLASCGVRSIASVGAFAPLSPAAHRSTGNSYRHTFVAPLSVSKTETDVTADLKKASANGAAKTADLSSAGDAAKPAGIASIKPVVIVDEVAKSTTSISSSGISTSPSSGNAAQLEGLAWRGVVIILCALWASNFAVVKLITAEPGVDSTLYAVTRFSVAALALLPGAVNALRKSEVMDAEIARGAAACGSWVAFGYLGQTLGLLTTTASRSCVICSLHCVFVACVAEIWRVNRAKEAGKNGAVTKFDTKRLLPAAIAVAGVAIVELQGAAGAPTIGDALSFAQPVGFGMGYLTLEELMAKRPDAALPVSAIKLVVVALASLGLFEIFPLINGAVDVAAWHPSLPDFAAILQSPVALGGILYTGLVTTAAALWVESIAFARVPATDASIILTTEPLFAALVSAVTLGETFGTSDYVGASLIVGGCVLAALMDNPGDLDCVVEEDPADQECKPERRWPFWGF